MNQLVNALDQRIVEAMVGTGGPLDGVEVMLYINAITLAKSTVIGDLDPATYTGYARQPVVWTGVYQAADGSMNVSGGLLEFSPTDAVTPNIVYGYALVDPTGPGVLLYAENFPAPVPLPDALHSILLSPRFSIGNPDSYGSGVVIS